MNGLSFSILIVSVSLHFCLNTDLGFYENSSLRFKPLSYETRIYESAPSDVEMVTLEAYFFPINNSSMEINYKLAPFDDYQYFQINSCSGKLSTKRSIDRKIGQQYNITILAESRSFHNRIINTSMPLSIIVSQYNLFEPQFTCSKYNAKIQNLCSVGSKVLEVKAVDRDTIDYNSRIIYSIVWKNKSHLPFEIDPSSALIITTDRIPFPENSYTFEIKAQNTGSPIKYSTAIISIEVNPRLSAPFIESVTVQETTANICWSMTSNQSIDGFLIKYKGEYESKPTTINITSNNNFECHILYEIEPNVKYWIRINAWNKDENGYESEIQHFISKKNCNCGPNSLCKPNSNGVCICPQGILGMKCEPTRPCPCANNSTCVETTDHIFRCICRHGYDGDLCQKKVKCREEMTKSLHGSYRWGSIEYGQIDRNPCLTGVSHYATRLCLLMANGSAVWDNVNDTFCLQQTMMMTDYKYVNSALNSRLDSKQLISMASTTKSNAMTALKTIDDFLASDPDDSYSDSTDEKIPNIVEKLLSVVPILTGEEFIVQHKNIAAKVVSISNTNTPKGISFQPKFNSLTPSQPSIKLPAEALAKAMRKTDFHEIRVQISIFNNQKLFQTLPNNILQNDMPVIQATVGNSTIDKLNEPVVVNIHCFYCNLSDYLIAKCVFWNENERNWSTQGIKTEFNVNNKSITCHSSHLTAFSVLFDLTPYENSAQTFIISTITYIGCYLSISGLFLTIITYSLFRCLNRENSGKILLHLCISLMGLNISFIIGSQKSIMGLNDSCALVAVLIHYFVLTSLSWMFVEAVHIYQLLIHVFATAETHFMLKRTILAWGLPMVWVFATLLISPNAYFNRNDFCMISAKYASVYYISYLMPASVLIIVNFSVFVLATKVLFTPRLGTKTLKKSGSVSKVSWSQIRGAFTVMTLLGIGWIFGALAVGEAKLVFQYIFSITNSLQGFFIFIVRCIQYPEARNAWLQLLKTGTLKKHRGQPQRMQGSNSNSNRLSASDRKPSKETDSTYSMTANSSRLSKPFISTDEDCDVQHFTTYDSIRVSATIS